VAGTEPRLVKPALVERSTETPAIPQLVVRGHVPRCFLCAQPLRRGRPRTVEHVFPRWLATRCDMHDRRVALPDGLTVHHARVTVDCCVRCNGDLLGAVESRMSTAAAQGALGLAAVSDATVLLWLGKIHHGLAWYQRQQEQHGMTLTQTGVVDPRCARLRSMLARGVQDLPVEGAVARIRLPGGRGRHPSRFEFVSFIEPMVTAVRLGSTGLVAVFEASDGSSITPTEGAAPDPSGSSFRRLVTTIATQVNQNRPAVLLAHDTEQRRRCA
jgi:hypothetical protein